MCKASGFNRPVLSDSNKASPANNSLQISMPILVVCVVCTRLIKINNTQPTIVTNKQNTQHCMVQQLFPVQQVLALPAVFSISPRHSYKKWAASCGLATILSPHNLSPKLVFMAHLVQLRGWCCHSASQYKIWGTLLWWYSPIHHHKQYYLDNSCLETAQCWAHSSSTNTQHTPKFQPGEVLVSGGEKSAWPSFVI